MTVIALIAHFPDHLKKWAKSLGKPQDSIKTLTDESLELKIIIDLSNREKHGGHPRDGGLSKKSPVISNLTRVLRLKPGHDYMSISFPLSTGYPVAIEGSPLLITNADILDSNGEKIYELRALLENGLLQLETLFNKLSQEP